MISGRSLREIYGLKKQRNIVLCILGEAMVTTKHFGATPDDNQVKTAQ